MTDYLGRLAERTIAPRSVVRPRIASAFETAALEQESFVVAPRPAQVIPSAFEGSRVPGGATSTPSRSTDGARDDTGREPIESPAPDVVETIRHEEVERVVERAVASPPEVIERVERRSLEPAEVRTDVVHERRVPRVVDRLRVRRERIAGASESPAPAPIEITIGRIDVRAVVDATPQKAQPKRPLIMSIEEYVAKRDGGGK